MATQLTYHVRNGSITGMVGGHRVSVSTQQGASPDLGSWAKMQGLDVRWEVVDYQAGGANAISLTHPRGSLATCRHYATRKNVFFVDDGGPGFLIHGWPPCTGCRCVAVNAGWEALFSALARERRGSIRIL